MKFIQKVVAIISLVVLATTAYASPSSQTVNLGSIQNESVFGITNDLGTLNELDIVTFADVLTFTVDVAQVFTYNFTNSQNPIPTSPIDNLFLDLQGPSPFDFGGQITTKSQEGFLNLAAGDYTLNISGELSSTGTYDMTISPVPEASTVAMMLSGLVVAGFMARRRQR